MKIMSKIDKFLVSKRTDSFTKANDPIHNTKGALKEFVSMVS